jgi:hypothetical protein
MVWFMKRGLLKVVAGGWLLVSWGGAWAEAPAAAVAGFNNYVGVVEARLAEEHRAADGFLTGEAGSEEGRARLRRGEVMVEQVSPPEGAGLPGALLHHWRGTAFAAGAKAADFERLLRDFGGMRRPSRRRFCRRGRWRRTAIMSRDGCECASGT